MFYLVSKTFYAFARPLHLILILLVLGLGLQLTPWRRLGIGVLSFAVAVLLFLSLTPAAYWMTLPLELRFPRIDHVDQPPDGIIVLGGANEYEPEYGRPNLVSLNDAGERLTEIPRLAALYPKARILYTGGPVDDLGLIPSEAQAAKNLFVQWGIAPDRIILEDRSLTTWENAVYSMEVVKPAPGTRWLLVTSAFHMPRAMGVFRKVGWPGLIPYPTDYRAPDPAFGIPWDLVASDNLSLVELATKEYFGLLGYWLGGRLSSLFPGPDAASAAATAPALASPVKATP